MKQIFWCIYRITNKINGKTYIGQHRYSNEKNPMGKYWGSGKYLHHAINKYGIENFEREVIYRRIRDIETADAMEIWAIAKERKENKNGCYNILAGGNALSVERAKKLSDSLKGREPWNKGKTGIYSEETKKRMIANRKSTKGIPKGPMSDEHRKHLSEARKGKKYKPHSEETKRKMRDAWERRRIEHPVSEETRKKLSETSKGRRHSDETRKHLSEMNKGEKNAMYGKHHTEEARKKISDAWYKSRGRIKNESES